MTTFKNGIFAAAQDTVVLNLCSVSLLLVSFACALFRGIAKIARSYAAKTSDNALQSVHKIQPGAHGNKHRAQEREAVDFPQNIMHLSRPGSFSEPEWKDNKGRWGGKAGTEATHCKYNHSTACLRSTWYFLRA